MKIDISLWRNADQNENQGTHEIELLQAVMSTAALMQKSERKVVLGDLVAKTGKRSQSKIMPHTLQVIANFLFSISSQTGWTCCKSLSNSTA